MDGFILPMALKMMHSSLSIYHIHIFPYGPGNFDFSQLVITKQIIYCYMYTNISIFNKDFFSKKGQVLIFYLCMENCIKMILIQFSFLKKKNKKIERKFLTIYIFFSYFYLKSNERVYYKLKFKILTNISLIVN